MTRKTKGLTLDPSITRRDFINTTLVGAGAALLHGCGPGGGHDGESAAGGDGPGAQWNGPGGIGDYADSNGTTWRTMEAGHRIRDGAYADPKNIKDTGENYDVVIVGGGFAGLGALHTFRKENPRGSSLLLDNQEIPGGYAKANAFDVDGHRVVGSQASLNFVLPKSTEDPGGQLWSDLGLPAQFQFAEREDGNRSIGFSRSTSGPLYMGEQSATTGYFFQNAGQGTWVKDIFSDNLQRAPWPEQMKASLLAMRDRKLKGPPEGAEAERLDKMTFTDFATRELKATPEALTFITQGMCVTGPQISAYGARGLPGLERFASGSAGAITGERFMSFPAGNTIIARAIVRSAIPDAFAGPATVTTLGETKLNHAALDRAGSACRMRMRSTVVRVANLPDGRSVEVVYEQGGRLHRVRGKSVVMAIGAWVAKHVVQELPEARRAALNQYLYSPILMVNVALRNWRFLDKLGFSAARWFEGFGFYCNIRQPMIVDGRSAPFHPDKPIVMTVYVPFPKHDLPLEAQGPAARAELYATSYAQYEQMVVEQMQRMFGPGGFDARRDIAGIVLNRWGHAFVTPPPGFFFGLNGGPAPIKASQEPLGRIRFAQTGMEGWAGAAAAGQRAASEVLQIA